MALLLVGMSHRCVQCQYIPKRRTKTCRYIYTRTLVGLFPQNIVNSQYVCTGLLYTLQCTFAFCSKCNLRGYWIQHLSVREQKNASFCIKDCGSPDHKYKPSLLFLEFLLPAGWILGYHLFDTNIFVCIVFKKWYIQIFICIYIHHTLVGLGGYVTHFPEQSLTNNQL